jgi:tetratricopeptide (TPR) repeat protein
LYALATLGIADSAAAQTVTSRPVVQPLPSQDTQRLNRALVELAKAPRSVPALLEAGNAALAVNDLDSALSFFRRLAELDSDNAGGALGMARVYLRSGRPVMALLYFDAAQSRGAGPLAIGSDQALTYDLLGDQAAAQAAYLRLLEASPKDDEARRRLALSYAIAGNRPAFEATLRPLLERRDFAAFRARTFGLAILGEQERAAAIAEAVMPRTLSQKVTPYLEFMPRLTAAQQAAAANLGVFPRAADVGRDPPGVLAYLRDRGVVARAPSAGPSTSPDARLAPAGAPLDNREREGAAPDEPPGEESDAADTAQPAVSEAQPAPSPEPEPVPEPEAPAHPARIWVQVATGSDLAALGFDWRRIARRAGDLLDRFTPHTVAWGQTNRLLAGPVESREDARDLINALNRKGLDSFRYTSPEGREIQELRPR